MNLLQGIDPTKFCNIPSKGGLPVQKIKEIAASLGISTKGLKKAELCELILASLQQPQSRPEPQPHRPAKQLPPLPRLPPRQPNQVPGAAVTERKFLKIPKQRTPSAPSPATSSAPSSATSSATSSAPSSAPGSVTETKLFEEVTGLVITSYEAIHCCLEAYQEEIAALGKKKMGQHAKGFQKIEQFLESYLNRFEKFYYTYLVVEKQDSRVSLLRFLRQQIPQILQTYIQTFHQMIIEVPAELVILLFPPPGHPGEPYPEERKRCNKAPRLGSSNLNCIRSDIMQMITRFAILGATMEKKVRREDLKNEVAKFAEMARGEANALNEMQRHLDGWLLCRAEYCDPNLCQEIDQGFFRKKKCVPRKEPIFADRDWFKKVYLSKSRQTR